VSSPAAEDLALGLDPTLIMRRAGLEPDEWQRSLLLSPRNRWYIVLCCRQGAGKTTAGAALLAHNAVAYPGSLSVCAAPTERQVKESMRRVHEMYAAARGESAREDDLLAMSLETSTGSRVVGISDVERTARGLAGVSLIVADEAARISPELYHTVTPFLSTTGGRLVMLSTPWLRRGYMYQEWRDGGDEYERVRIDAYQCPRIDPAFLARERRTKPASWFAREYLAEWGSSSDAVFDPEMVERIVDPDLAVYRPERMRA